MSEEAERQQRMRLTLVTPLTRVRVQGPGSVKLHFKGKITWTQTNAHPTQE